MLGSSCLSIGVVNRAALAAVDRLPPGHFPALDVAVSPSEGSTEK